MTRRTSARATHPPADTRRDLPLVAIVGRPNVGKSTLFNRLVGRHVAIVEDEPGVTRDRHYAQTSALGKPYLLVDMGGLDAESTSALSRTIADDVHAVLEEADAIVCVLDATSEPLQSDREVVALLRRVDKPVFFVANKSDSPSRQHDALDHYQLGMEQLFPISAVHGHGMGELEEALAEALPMVSEDNKPQGEGAARVCVIGRPNAGKSSTINALLGADRQKVDAKPGTTIDSIDVWLDRKNPLVLVDTAGMRRKRAIDKGLEGLAVLYAIRSMERSDVAVLLIDATEGVAEQDTKIAGLAEERGRALVIALNKVDLLSNDERRAVVKRTREVLGFARWAPMVTLSAKKKTGLNHLLRQIDRVVVEHRRRVGTSQANRFFEEVLENHPPPAHKHRPVRLFYVSQVETAPPTFMIVTNEPKGIHFSYQRYVINQLRQQFGFQGTPIRVRYRPRRRRK